jgi:hypothetical protein
MVIVQDTIVSDEIFEMEFICNLSACKGACCWEGDSGAPLEFSELAILDEISEKVRPFLSEAGKKVLDDEGGYKQDPKEKTWETTLIDGGPCTYMTYDAQGTAQCGIEQAHRAGVIDFKKPISCHLYPIRVTKNEALGFEALNYDEWSICSAACALGKENQVPVYRFLKEPLIRKYGEAFYEEMEASAAYLKSQKKSKEK